jgi:HlyD family secretion protein
MNLFQRIMRILLPLSAALGAVVGVIFILTTAPDTSAQPSKNTPPSSPIRNSVAGAGVIEPASELVQIGTPRGGIIAEVYVVAGQKVQRNDPLFQMDTHSAIVELKRQRAVLSAARQQIAAARVEAARSADSLKRYRAIGDARAMTNDELARRRFALDAALAALAVREADAEQSEAAVRVAETELALLTVRASIDAQVLRVQARPGQYAPANVLSDALVTLGSPPPLHVRIDVDEADIGRLSTVGSAQVITRGTTQRRISATFLRIEPLVIPKRSLTNAAAEEVDTRVLQVIYVLPQASEGFFVGQQVDAFLPAQGSAP